jgi:hypothetical protein
MPMRPVVRSCGGSEITIKVASTHKQEYLKIMAIFFHPTTPNHIICLIVKTEARTNPILSNLKGVQLRPLRQIPKSNLTRKKAILQRATGVVRANLLIREAKAHPAARLTINRSL